MSRRRCENCGGSPALPVVYGYPSRELMEEAGRGAVILGGCSIGESPAEWLCPQCAEAGVRDLVVPHRLETPRLSLEPLAASHADALYELYRDPEVSRLLFTRPSSRSEFDEIHRRAIAFGESHGMWAIQPRGAPTVIGRVGFFAFGEAARPELAFLLSSRAWGRGYATEACRAGLDHALRVHPWTEVVAIIRPANTAAIRVVQRLGFTLEAETLLNGEHSALFQAGRNGLVLAS